MTTPRRTGLTALLGVLVVVVGVLVLRAPAAQAQVGWFSYDGPPPPEVLDRLVAWNLPRAVGALLVLVGVLVLAHLLGALAAGRGDDRVRRLARPVTVLGFVLVLGGLVAFGILTARVVGDRSEATVAISKFSGFRPELFVSWSVWAPDQLAAVLLAATGLVVLAVATGLRRAPR